MRGQYALEAILVVACFFALIGVFGGLYLRLSDLENRISQKNKMQMDLDLLVSRANNAYFLGDGTEFPLRMRTEANLQFLNGSLMLSSGEIRVSKKVFSDVKILGYSSDIVVYNSGGTIFISTRSS